GTIWISYRAFGYGAAAFVSMLVFGASMIILYSTSSIYHCCCAVGARASQFLQRLDHMAIFLLIAGTYTPICVITLGYPLGMIMLSLVWGAAAAGILMKIFWMHAPVWLSSLVYLILGWMGIFFILPIVRSLSLSSLIMLAAGGLLYTVGAVIFTLERPCLRLSWFGSHELFHLFVIGGTLCHFFSVFNCLA
ncbi:MAG: hemolysin III family protein, partial [Synergistes sp.]|nr:hemolysin III family protein [Synergistes sp.]